VSGPTHHLGGNVVGGAKPGRVLGLVPGLLEEICIRFLSPAARAPLELEQVVVLVELDHVRKRLLDGEARLPGQLWSTKRVRKPG
jgi:hypothetical protein